MTKMIDAKYNKLLNRKCKKCTYIFNLKDITDFSIVLKKDRSIIRLVNIL